MVLELDEADLLLDNFIDTLADICEVLRAASLAQLSVGAGNRRVFLEGVEVCSLRLLLRGIFLRLHGRVLPERLDAGEGFGGAIRSGDLAGEGARGHKTVGVPVCTHKHLEHLVLSTDHFLICALRGS